MKKQKVKITDRDLLETEPSLFSELEFGNVYLLFSNEFGIHKKLFSEYKKRISFINSPFEGAVKIPSFDRISKVKRLECIKLINDLTVYPAIDGHGYLDKILVIITTQLAENDIILIETTGLDEASILQLVNYGHALLRDLNDKLIIIVDFYYSNSKKIWIALADKAELKNNISEYLPANLLRLRNESRFKIKPHL